MIIVSHHLQDIFPLVDEVVVLDKGKILLHTSKVNFFTTSFTAIKRILRVPELFHVGVNLCKAKGVVPEFEDADKLFHLIGGINSD